jgi:hypothetical protein
MQLKASEVVIVSQGTENLPIELILQIDITSRSIGKPKVDYEPMNVFGFYNARQHFSLQWRYLFQGLLVARKLPVIEQLMLMHFMPLKNVLQRSFREATLQRSCIDLYGNLEIAIYCVEMRRNMIPIKQSNDNA